MSTNDSNISADGKTGGVPALCCAPYNETYGTTSESSVSWGPMQRAQPPLRDLLGDSFGSNSQGPTGRSGGTELTGGNLVNAGGKGGQGQQETQDGQNDWSMFDMNGSARS